MAPHRSHGLNILNPANWGVERINAQHRASSPQYMLAVLGIAVFVLMVAVVVDFIR
jgi:hypothetical protein